ncbi:MAG: hypothetical protein ACKO6Q_01510 [Bacteroidota bacterium]
MSSQPPRPSSDRSIWRYLGLATQIMAYLIVAVWAGMRLDRAFTIFPLLTATMPLLVLIALFVKLLRETRH